MGAPSRAAMETAMSPTVSEMRVPCSTRLATSRPNWSLPSTKRGPGGWSASRTEVLMGSRELSKGAPTARTTSVPRTMRPTMAPRWRASLPMVPRPGAGVEETGRSSAMVEVAAHDQSAEPGPAEHGLDDDRPGQEIAELQPEDRQHGNEGVLESVAEDHAPPGQTFRPGRAHVVLAEHLEHARPGQPGDDGGGDGPQRDRGENEVEKVPAPRRGEPAQV